MTEGPMNGEAQDVEQPAPRPVEIDKRALDLLLSERNRLDQQISEMSNDVLVMRIQREDIEQAIRALTAVDISVSFDPSTNTYKWNWTNPPVARSEPTQIENRAARRSRAKQAESPQEGA